ncbi:hypothetical protein HYU16_04965 [Candidatus Woesearchaeota archaeon]|nr:hypothetical protein [Candidatus Woesearchaeota archaeon]
MNIPKIGPGKGHGGIIKLLLLLAIIAAAAYFLDKNEIIQLPFKLPF